MRLAAIFTSAVCIMLVFAGAIFADDLTEIYEVDLNGDGITETIEITWCEQTDEYMRSFFEADFYYSGDYTVRINGFEYSGSLEFPDGHEIIDIDESDGYKEIMLTDYGPSDDPNCIIFGYDGSEMFTVGEFYGDNTFDGAGSIYSEVWQGFFSATFLFKLDPYNHTLELVEQDLYSMDWCCNMYESSNCEYTVTEAFPIYTGQSFDSVLHQVEPGDTITFIAARAEIEEYTRRNFNWFLVVTDQGLMGWITIDQIRSLDGLCMAD